MIRVGITGIIGSGKSTVSALLRNDGFCVIDLDSLAKEALGWADVAREVEQAFGKGFVRGRRVDVDRMREIAFKEKGALSRLEEIVHPRILAELDRRVGEERRAGTRAVIIDAPLLFEKGLNRLLDRVVVVSADMGRIKDRLKLRGMAEEDAEMRLSHQTPLEEKERMADYVIRNDGTMEDLKREAAILIDRIKGWEVTVHAS
jgi:dephospho-CoA kinase